MDYKLHLLDSFAARGADGQTYKVCAYEHLVQDRSLPTDGQERWEPNGQVEYRLAGGESVEELPDGSLRLRHSQLTLTPVGLRH
ncbi:hypothetical protein [Piscinibacter gummiphilus]|uniref:Uncharacterized protein n=1 Tax=Piscinibacter gummiphilus TaxID=946333 RepID=A0ABZ0D637_9BURK|nr:hypothetical protein [Piscinibacter gummiphilus]WOB10830.1 hypothetical protein RXV79_12430 [Piscinibacter gummiphilus]